MNTVASLLFSTISFTSSASPSTLSFDYCIYCVTLYSLLLSPSGDGGGHPVALLSAGDIYVL